jgi:hypothetical protein
MRQVPARMSRLRPLPGMAGNGRTSSDSYPEPGTASAGVATERIPDELALSFGIRLPVLGMLRRQPPLEVPVPPRQVIIAPQRIAERDLLRPPRMTSRDHVQVGRTDAPRTSPA